MRALLILLLSTTPVLAAPYEGVWATSRAACTADPARSEGAALRIRGQEIEQGESLCRITTATVAGGDWTLRALCASEGVQSRATFRSRNLVRCRDADFQSLTD